MAITNLTGTKWRFNEILTSSFSNGANINFIVNNENYTYIRCFQTNTFILYYQKQDGTQNTTYNASWTNRAYMIIEITGGEDVENTNFIAWLEQNAKQVKNLTNTTWIFKEMVATTTGLGTYKINFTSNNENFVRLGLDYRGYTPISYYKADGTEVTAFDNSQWTNNKYRTITITGGEDVESMNLLSFLNEVAAKPLTFAENKTALQIYDDLLPNEYDSLEKEPNTFYLVNGVGVYKGEKLIASIADISNLEYDVGQLQNYVGTLNAECSNLETNKQDKLTAGTGITITGNVISATGGSSSEGGVTEDWVNQQISNQHQDLSDLFTLTNTSMFTLKHQHAHKVGPIVFVHITFATTAAPSSTGMFDFGTLSSKPLHNHSFALAAINESTGNVITEGATLKTDGTLVLHLTKSNASSKFLFDLSFFFCEAN